MCVSRKITKNKINGANHQAAKHNSIYAVKMQSIYVLMPSSSYKLQESANEVSSHSEATNAIHIQCN